MPALGLSAVPLPMNVRRMLPGCHPPSAAADDAAVGPAGSALLIAAAALVVFDALSSRRDAASAAHANGPATGASPPEPVCSHDNTEAPTAVTEPAPRTAAAGAATGVGAATTEPAAGTPIGAKSSATAEEPDDTTGEGISTAGVTGIATDGRTDGTVGVRRPGAAAGPESCERVEDRGPGAAAAAPGEGPRPPRRGDTAVDADGAPCASAEPDPVDPADPVVSANANGIDAAADPIPSATARAPTRPTYRANPSTAGSIAGTERSRYSIDRMRPVAVRRCWPTRPPDRARPASDPEPGIEDPNNPPQSMASRSRANRRRSPSGIREIA